MGRLFQGIIGGVLFVRARNALARNRFAKSMAIIEYIYKIMGLKKPSKDAFGTLNVLCAVVAIELEDYALSIEASSIAVDQIETALASPRANKNIDTIRYMSAYIKTILDYLCEGAFGPEITSRAQAYSNKVSAYMGPFNIEKVSGVNRTTFPLAI